MIALLAIAGALVAGQDTTVAPIPDRVLHLHRAADEALVAGRYDAAKSDFERALEIAPTQATLAYGMASVSTRLDRPDEALRWLELAFGWGYGDAEVARWDPDLAALRPEATHGKRFESILAGAAQDTGTHSTESKILLGRLDMPVRPDPRGERIALGWSDGRIQLVDAASGVLEQEWDGGAGAVRAVAFSLQCDVLACLHEDGTLTRWDVASGERLSAAPISIPAPIGRWARLDYVGSGERILGHWSGRGMLWTSEGEVIADIPLGPYPAKIAWSPIAEQFVVTSFNEFVLREVSTGAPVGAPVPVESGCHGLALSPDGARLAIGSTQGRVFVFDARTGEPLWSTVATDSATGTGIDIWGEPLTVPVVTFSPSSDALAVSTTVGYFIHVYDAKSGEWRWGSGHLGGRMGAAMPLTFGEDFLIADSGRLRFEAKTGRSRALQAPIYGHVDISAEGHLLVQVGAGYAWFDAATGIERYRWLEVGRDQVLLQHRSGWFAGTLTRSTLGERPDGSPLRLDIARFDPKRLRAAQAGVPLTPPQASSAR